MGIAEVLAGTERWWVEHGDCLRTMKTLPDASVDAIVCDPPAGIAFMGKAWDGDKGGRDRWIEWLHARMREAIRVLKPGGHALVWALPRTSHWTATAIEDAGFEVRDCLTHLFGSGFPKSLNVSRAIDAADGLKDKREVISTYTAGGNAGVSTADKGGTYGVGVGTAPAVELAITRGASERSREWDGWGTALKPASEHWWLARKPLAGTVASNVLAYGTGALNVDGCRIGTDWSERSEAWKRSGHSAKPDAEKIAAPPGTGINCHELGRWPANVTLDEDAAAMLDEQSGTLKNGGQNATSNRKSESVAHGEYADSKPTAHAGDSGGASRFFYVAKPSTKEESEWESGDLSRQDQTGVTSPRRDISGRTSMAAQGSSSSTTLCGKSTMGQCQLDIASTTRTKTSKTTEPTTSNLSTQLPTSESILDANCETACGGSRAESAENSSPSVESTGTSPSRDGPSTGSASSAIAPAWQPTIVGARFLYRAKPSTREREAGCDALPLVSAGNLVDREEGAPGTQSPRAGAGRTSAGRRNSHPTCKSIALMRWLVRLVTPPGGLVLDPFCGSGTTGCAAALERFRFIGIDENEDYVRIANARIAYWAQPRQQAALFEVSR